MADTFSYEEATAPARTFSYEEATTAPAQQTKREEPKKKRTVVNDAMDFVAPARGVVEAATNIGAGMVLGPAAGLAGLAGAALPGPEGQGADWVRRVQGMVPEPTTSVGKGITNALAYPFQKLAEGADVAGGKVSDVTGSPALGALTNTAIQSLPMVAGKVASKVMPGGELPSTTAGRITREAQNVNKDAITAELRDQGYALPLSQTNPTMLNKSVEGLAGKVKGNQDYSLHNQEITNSLVRDEFGIPQDKPLTLDFFRNYRRAEGQKYDVARQTGTVDLSQPFKDAVDKAVEPFKSVAKDAPDQQLPTNSDLLRRAKSLGKKNTLESSTVVDLISQFRERANSLFDNKQRTAGRATKAIADALENELQDHVIRTGQSPDIVQGVIEARRNMAKAHDVEDALTANGDVDARDLGKKWDDGKGTPFTGNLLTVAKLGAEFPKVAQSPRKIGGVPMSPLDYASTALIKGALSGGAGAAAFGAPGVAAMAIPFARPLIRNALASGPVQRGLGTPSYGPSFGSRLLALQENPLASLAEMSQGQHQ